MGALARSFWILTDFRDFSFIQHILLVGGFGESPYLQIQLREEFKSPRLDITVMEDGALVCFHDVGSRVGIDAASTFTVPRRWPTVL